MRDGFCAGKRTDAGRSGFGRARGVVLRREGVGVFLSRWLLTRPGPVVNLTAGATRCPWPRFLLYDVLGVLPFKYLREPDAE
jgi:membrane protein DedA with SNARE-associated domain